MGEFEFEVVCKKCGKSTWIYGTQEDEDSYDEEGYICLECREKEEK